MFQYIFVGILRKSSNIAQKMDSRPAFKTNILVLMFFNMIQNLRWKAEKRTENDKEHASVLGILRYFKMINEIAQSLDWKVDDNLQMEF